MNAITKFAPAALAVAALGVAPAAGAQSAAPEQPLEVTGAYLYLDHEPASGQTFVRAVMETDRQLPRRHDGLIRAGIQIEGVGHSIGSIGPKGAPIYTGATEVKSGKVATIDADGDLVRVPAKVGRKFRVVLETRDGAKVTRTLTLRKERKGDDQGKPVR